MPIDLNLISAIAALDVPAPPATDDPQEQRKGAFAYEQAVYSQLGAVGPELPTREHIVPVEGHPDVLVRLYYPREPAADLNLPVCLHFFGGGWRQGGIHHPSVATHCAVRAAKANIVVAAISYALAPEHPYPAALEQGYAALEWLVREAGSLGVDPTRIALSGQSAGGNLVAALTHVNRDRARHPLAMQILEVPGLDLTLAHTDRDAIELPDEQWAVLEHMIADYVPRAEDRLSPYASPLLAEDFRDLPPAYIVTAECDPFRGDGEAYAAALAGAGIPVAALRLVGLTHEGGLYERASLTARTGQAAIATALRTLHD
ncbi:alpha/beta hydrolase [Streptomyces sp. NPDC056486]|uniref:alpha/beta hydrolase n=1 Tax=Streptomyces sp. NPDC056486 TaxID=3345835 RepID=UPI0036AC8A9A